MIRLIKTKKALIQNGFICEIFENEKDLLKYLDYYLKEGSTAAIGGSVTIEELGIYEKLKEKNIKTFWHWKDKFEGNEEINAHADIYLSSANAITEDGALYFVDQLGNRISSICFGHDKVFIIAGRNKIVKSLDEARERVKNISVPLNTFRHNASVEVGDNDYETTSVYSTANMELFFKKNPENRDIYVFLVDADLGY
ncbi:lactate utilization protein [Peptoniphilus sp.]|jgi:hypothetical protein|uniref:lactate utilization protein n=1 Tax=Peptoniphilus sp. TaxID=1971214 RepID=UPI003D9072CF